jgi:hypothetical protein
MRIPVQETEEDVQQKLNSIIMAGGDSELLK